MICQPHISVGAEIGTDKPADIRICKSLIWVGPVIGNEGTIITYGAAGAITYGAAGKIVY